MASPFDAPAFSDRLFFPRKEATPTPDGAEDHRVDVPGGRLHLRWHRSPGARIALLHFHGNGEVVSDYDDLAPAFARCGAQLLAVDYRGYGLSQGTPTLRALISDAHAVARWAAARSPLPLGVYGRSLGSACAAELLGDPTAPITLGIWESGFSDLRGLVARRGLPPPAAFAPEDRAAFDPLPKLARATVPVLVLHGERDEHLDPAESRRAFEACGRAERRFVLVPGRGHNDLGASPVTWQALADFLAGQKVPGE